MEPAESETNSGKNELGSRENWQMEDRGRVDSAAYCFRLISGDQTKAQTQTSTELQQSVGKSAL